MNIKQKKGFTLLEIIIVIIIIGVLASLALPRFFRTVEFSRTTEAMTAFTALRDSMERCYLAANGSYAGCSSIGVLDLENPGTSPGAHFNYAVQGVPTSQTYTLRATRNTIEGGVITDWIELQVNTTGATRTGTGKYSSIK